MSGLLTEQRTAATSGRPGVGRRVRIIGAPCGFGASIAGVDLGPAAMRVAGLRRRVERLGYEVR
ncbi:MAG: arginase, partial [Acidobacteria bacterium]